MDAAFSSFQSGVLWVEGYIVLWIYKYLQVFSTCYFSCVALFFIFSWFCCHPKSVTKFAQVLGAKICTWAILSQKNFKYELFLYCICAASFFTPCCQHLSHFCHPQSVGLNPTEMNSLVSMHNPTEMNSLVSMHIMDAHDMTPDKVMQ
jgi:hypothetical protein